MNNYFTKFILQLGQDSKNVYDSNVVQENTNPEIKYLSVFNPSTVDDKCESNEELMKQVLCFISPNVGQSASNNNTQIENNYKLKVIGLVRGIDAFTKGFAKDPYNKTNIIKTDATITIVKFLENSYYIVSCISLPATSNNSGIISHQMSKLIDQAYNHFVTLNGSFGKISNEYNLETLNSLLNTYWKDFIHSYNSQHLSFPRKFQWTNSLNYKGFLGLLGKDSHPNVYKKSSIILNDSAKCQIDKILHNGKLPQELKPKGLLISCFNKSALKKYGMIYSNSSSIEENNGKLIQPETLADIYNWLEYFDYHHKLDSRNLTALDSKGFFASPEIIRHQTDIEPPILSTFPSGNDPDSRSIISTAASTFDMINPVNLTNNYIIQPLNSTMNNVMSFGGLNSGIANLAASFLTSSNTHWLTIPSYLKLFRQETDDNQTHTNIEAAEEQISNNDSLNDGDTDEYGNFIIGLTGDVGTGNNIQKKLVYLNSRVKDDEGRLKYEEREYLLICYIKNDILISFIYDSSSHELDQEEFYINLAKVTMYPLIEEMNNLLMNESIMGNSIGSLPRSLDALRMSNVKPYISPGQEIEATSNFYFVIYDSAEGWIKSSLPYLPVSNPIENTVLEDDAQLNKATLKYNSAIIHLHDQLSDLFIVQNNNEFFKGDSMNEYFHKFNSSKHFDWMFYYIKYNNKFIIVIKSRNRNHKITYQRNSSTINKQTNNTASSASTITSNQPNGNNILHQITDYANLGFLNNLGDDVKLWLESFSINGEI